MCRIDSKTYQYPDGTSETSERIIRCQDARGLSLCSQVERREVGSTRLVEMTPTSVSASSVRSPRPSSSSSGRSKTAHDLSRRSSRRRSGRYEISTAAFPSPTTGTRMSPTRVPPRAPSPPPTGVELPPSGDNTWAANTAYVRLVAPDGVRTSNTPSSRNSGVFILEEVVPETQGPSSVASTNVEQASRLCARRQRPGLAVDTSRRSSGSASPAMSSPGLSQIQRLHIRHDSVQGSPPKGVLPSKPRRPREGSSNLHSPRVGSASSSSTERRRKDPERRPGASDTKESPVPNPIDDLAEEDLRQMQSERAEATARKRQSADASLQASPGRGANPPYSIVVHHHPTTDRRNSVHGAGEDIVAREQARPEKRRSRGSQRQSSR